MRIFAYLFSISSIVLAFSLGMMACASIINGDHEEVAIMAKPSGAEITIDGLKRGTDSVRCELKRGTEHYIVIAKDGYQSMHIRTGIGVEPWFWGNVVTAFLFSGFDVTSGSGYTVLPNPALVNLSHGADEPTDITYDKSGRWIERLPLAVLGVGLAVFFIWFVVGTTRMYDK